MALGDYVPGSLISAPVVAASPTANAASAADTPRPLSSGLQVRHEVTSFTGSDVAKSPTSYSSRSLGLSSLDFGYDKHIVGAIIPSSPGNSLSSESSPANSLVSAGSHLEVLGANAADQGRDSPHGDIVLNHIPCYEVGTLEEVMMPLIVAEPTGLIDVNEMDADDGVSQKAELPMLAEDAVVPDRCSEYSVELVVSTEIVEEQLPNEEAVNSALASSIVYELGSADKISFSAMQKTHISQPEISSPYVVRDIDELLKELGIADTLINGDNAAGKAIASDAPLPLNPEEDNDSFSLREIDELLQQLDQAAGLCSETPKVSSAVASPDLNAQYTIATQPRPDAFVLSPQSIVASLGTSQRVIVAALSMSSNVEASGSDSCCLLDPAAVINSLGGVLDIQIPEQQETPFEQIVAELISSLGKAIALEAPEAQRFDVNELVSQLGNVEQICVAAARQLCSPLLDIPNIISGLGGVYSPDFMLHNVEQLRKASMHTLVNEEMVALDAACGRHSCEFPSLQLSSPKLHLLTDSLLVNMATMDVDESVMADSRSRTSSIISYNQPFEYFCGISKLMAALRIQPIVVSRPFLGPARRVLFPHLY
ncbi:hypothetical protein LPJ55_001927 [Coemansia sp. RSA 990]|nr:hypothetical protein LPJ55_001927 [Coemansia sp. RSA 990]